MSGSIADDLMERRSALIDQATEIAQKGVTEGRDLTADEQTKFDGMFAEAQKLAERAKAIRDGENAAHDLEESFRKATGREPQRQAQRPEGGLTEWARGAKPGDSYVVPSVMGAERRALARATSAEARALSETGGVGKDGVYGQLWEYAVSGSQILQSGVQILNTADGNTLPMPKATAHSSLQTATANVALTMSDATITTADLSVSKFGFLTLVPSELMQDVTFDLEGYISRSAGRALGIKVGAVASAAAISGFTTAGKTGPTGTSTSLGTQSTVGQGSDLLVDVFHSVLPEYRTSAAWLMADATAAVVRKLKDSNGLPVWQQALTAGDPDMILGKGVFIDSNLPSPAANAKTIYFGELAALVVRIAGGLRFERSTEYAFDADQVAFRCIVRAGALALDPNAVKYFAHSAT